MKEMDYSVFPKETREEKTKDALALYESLTSEGPKPLNRAERRKAMQKNGGFKKHKKEVSK